MWISELLLVAIQYNSTESSSSWALFDSVTVIYVWLTCRRAFNTIFCVYDIAADKSGQKPTLFRWQVCLVQNSLQHWILPWATCFDDLFDMLKVGVPVPKELRVAFLQKINKYIKNWMPLNSYFLNNNALCTSCNDNI